jgi:hypothetical protein
MRVFLSGHSLSVVPTRQLDGHWEARRAIIAGSLDFEHLVIFTALYEIEQTT